MLTVCSFCSVSAVYVFERKIVNTFVEFQQERQIVKSKSYLEISILYIFIGMILPRCEPAIFLTVLIVFIQEQIIGTAIFPNQATHSSTVIHSHTRSCPSSAAYCHAPCSRCVLLNYSCLFAQGHIRCCPNARTYIICT